jgi:hypothetical protein
VTFLRRAVCLSSCLPLSPTTNPNSRFLVLIVFLLVGFCAPAARGQQARVQVRQRHVRPEVANHQAAYFGQLAADTTLRLSVVLPLRNQAALTDLLGSLYDPKSPRYHHFLSVAEFTEQFGPTAQDYAAVVAYLQHYGLQTEDAPANRLIVPVSGSVAQISAAFDVQMNVYQHPTESRTFFSPDREPSLQLSIPIAHVSGLDNYSLPRHLTERPNTGQTPLSVNGSGPGGSYLGNDMRAAYYGGTTLDGTGQSVGLLEFGGYDPTDVALTFSSAGQSYNVPVNNVLLDGATGAPTSSGDGEEVLDIVQAIGMAPNLTQVRVYIGIGEDDPRILNSIATENLVKQIGCSWGWRPDDPATDDTFFQEMATQGQSFFAASGDSGAYDIAISPFFYPAEDQYVTTVGGTHLVTSGPGGTWVSEAAWNSEGDGTGGGISPDSIALPSYQNGLATTANGGSSTLRNVPDVAMEGDFDNFNCEEHSCSGTWAGTSFATPRWAGFMALVNQQAVEAGTAPAGGIGFLNPLLYTIAQGADAGADLHDIVSGNNDTANQPAWFNAVVGYDLTTGWGSAAGQNLINDLAGPQVPGFWLSASQTAISINPGSTGATTILISDAGGFTGGVTLAAASSLPSGITASFASNPATSSNVLTFTATSSATQQTFPVTVTGTSGTYAQSTTVTVAIHTPTFTLQAAPSYVTLSPGGTTTTTVTVVSEFGFSGSVNLGIAGLPTGVTASFSPTTTSGTSTLTLTATASATAANDVLTINGISGGISANATVNLTVAAPSFTLQPELTVVTAAQGGSASAYLEILASHGFNGNVTLAATNLPAGVTATFSPNPATSQANVLFTVSSTAAAGSYPVTLMGSSGSLTSSATITLTIVAPSFTLSAYGPVTMGQGSSTSVSVAVAGQYGFSGSVTLAVSGLPSGVTALLSPNPTLTSSALYLYASSTATPGQYSLNITGVSGSATASTSMTLIVSAPAFTLPTPLGTSSVGSGSSTYSYNFIQRLYGFSGSVTLSASNVPSGVTVSFSPNPLSSSTTEFETIVTASSSAIPGTYTVAVTGVSGSQTSSSTMTIVVNAPAFTLYSGGSVSVGQGQSGSTYVDANQQYGFNGNISLSVSGLPNGVTASFSSNPMVTSSTLTLQVGSAVSAGNYSLTITGTSGAITQTTSLTLTVGAPSFSLAIYSGPSGPPGQSVSTYVYLTDNYGFSSAVTLSVSGLPAGVTATFASNPTTAYSNQLTFNVGSSVPVGQYPLTITGTSGAQRQVITTTLIVVAPSFTLYNSGGPTIALGGTGSGYVYVEAANGFSSAVTLSISGLPSGVSAVFGTNPTTYSSMIAFAASSSAATGTSTFTITGTAGAVTQTTTMTITVAAPTFTLSTPYSLSVNQGGSITGSVDITPEYGFAGNATLSAIGLPSGVTASFSPNPATGASVMTLAAAGSATAGTYSFTVLATSGSLSQSAQAQVTVNAGNYSLNVAPSEVFVPIGASDKATAAIIPVNGFSSGVSLSVSGLPAGVTASFSPATATTSSTVTFTAGSAATVGSSVVTITGTSGTETALAQLTVVVTNTHPVISLTTLTITAAGSTVTTVSPGTTISATAKVTVNGGPVTAGLVYLCDATQSYCDAVHQLGVAVLNSSGIAVFHLVPGIGARSYKAVFAGTSMNVASTSPAVSLTVNGALATTTSLSTGGSPGSYTLNATVTGFGDLAPTGTMSFIDSTVSNAVLGTAPVVNSGATLSQTNSQTVSSLSYPSAIVARDLNGDGIPDLAVSNSSGNSVAILLGSSNGTFTAGTAVQIGATPGSIALGDFNSDSKLDLAVVIPGSSEIALYLGNGDGTFTASSTLQTLPSPGNLIVADVNGDGNEDLAVITGNTLMVLFGHGDGTFTADSYSPSLGSSPQSIVQADFNGDGITDLAITNYSYTGTVTVLLGNGDGSFTQAPTLSTTPEPYSIVVSDFNQDGKPDLAIGPNGGSGVNIFLGNGDGTFTAAASALATSSATTLAIADMNNDGKPDLVVGNSSTSSITTLLGNGDGTFKTGASQSLTYAPAGMVVGDWNGDGVPDVAATFYYLGAVNTYTTQLSQRVTATLSNVSPFGSGQHLVKATYPGDSGYTASNSSTVSLTATAAAPAVTVKPSLSTLSTTQPLNVTVSVSVGMGYPVPTGSVSLSSGSYTSSSAVLSNGSASISVPGSVLPQGTDPLSVAYTPDAAGSVYYIAATGAATVSVNQVTPNVTFGLSASSIPYTAPLTVTAQVTDPTSSAIPSGIITLTGGSYTSATVTLNSGNGILTVPAASLSPGMDNLTVTYTPDTAGALLYASANATGSVQVTPGGPVITWPMPASIVYGTALSAKQLDATTSVPGTFTYAPAAGVVLPAGQQTLSVAFTPTNTTDYSGTTATVTLSVSKATPAITWPTPAAILYGTPLGANQLNATASVAGAFIYTPAAGAVLSAGQQTLSVTFTPNDTADYTTTTATVLLTVTATAPIVTWATPSAITYGTALASAQLNATSSVAGTFVYNPAAGTVLPAGTQTLSITFTPTDSTDYKPATATVSLAVNKAMPTIAWPAPASITYGTALGSTQLNATASVPGTFAYTPAAGTVLGGGTQTLSVTFTPTDNVDYQPVTATVSLLVSKATPAIAWTAPASVNYGTALSSTQLDATASVAGTFSYSPAAGAPLPAGTQTLSVTFTPTDTTDYGTATATVNLAVNQAPSSVTWATPASITFGTPLSSAQLNATGSVPGTLTYSPAAGAVLPFGTQTLSVTLTPTDSADYKSATATVSLVVNKATPTLTWAAPAAIAYGTALSNTQCTATASIPGSFSYSPAIGTVLPAGTQTLTVIFTPTDAANYQSATAIVNLTVNKATQAVSWALPVPITYGTPLTNTQLAATASVPGTFGYSPAAGTVLPAGTQTLTVTFTPTDSTDYQGTVTSSTTLNVNKAVLTLGASNASRVYGTANPVFTGTLSGAVNGDTFTEALATTATLQSPAGGYAIVPSVSGANLADYTVAATNSTLTITPAATSTALGLSNQNLTLTATISPNTTGTPTGIVTFYAGSSSLGTGTLSNGAATLTLTSFPSGDVTLSAQYGGDINFAPSISASMPVLALSLSTTSLTVTSSGMATDTLTVAVPPGYMGSLQFSCTGLPSDAACSFQPSAVTFSGSATSGSSVLTLGTGNMARLELESPATHSVRLAEVFALPGLLLLLVRGKCRRLRMQVRLFSWCLLLLAAGAASTGCASGGSGGGGGGSSTTSTPPGTYSIQVVATGTASVSQSTTIIVTVQ